MTSKAAILALLTLWGVGTSIPHQAWANERTAESRADGDEAGAVDGDLVDRVWVKSGSALAGTVKIFLSDGTLVQDSVWQTHTLTPWQMSSARSLTWQEDGREVRADIVALTANELVLSLQGKDGVVEERYLPASREDDSGLG